MLLGVAGCDTISERAADQATAALVPTTTASPAPQGSAPSTTAVAVPACDASASYRPTEPLPAPGAMPAGSFMREIQDNGVLDVGVDENTMFFSSRPPGSNDIVGFEADLARELAAAIFGDPSRVHFTTLVTSEKVSAVETGLVDATISVVSATCARWQHVAFTTTYYVASQQVLVPTGSDIRSSADMPGHKVCVTDGSSSADLLAHDFPEVIPVAVAARTDCLVALQERRADAILLPSSILAGLHHQDPSTEILPERLGERSEYAIAIAHEHLEFVRFVNALLERWRSDGTLARLQDTWFAGAPELRTVPVAPEPVYLD
jgi:polar amino acid transport system substrate-binding protein